MFKRKKSVVHQEQSIKMRIEELPTKALEITYQAFMNDYEDEPRAEIQQKLSLLSKILNDRANDKTYQEGNGKLKKRIREKFPQITDEQFNKMSREEKNQLEKTLAEYDKLEQLTQRITDKAALEPKTIEFEMKAETPVTIKQDTSKNDTSISLEKPKTNLEGLQENRLKGLFKKKQTEKQEIKPKKKPRFTFLKKKKVVKQIQIPVTDEVVKTIDKIKQEQPEIFEKKEVTTEQKNRAKLMEVATVKKLFSRKKDDSAQKLDLKKLDEVYCNACKHSIKQHQTGGVSNGCKKCGCFTTIEEIAEQKGIELYEPSVVLDKIEQENRNVEELIKQTGQKEDVESVEDRKAREETEYIKDQSKKMAAMQSKKPEQAPKEPKKYPGSVNKPAEPDTYEKEYGSVDRPAETKTEPDSYDDSKKFLEEQKETKTGLQCICDHKLEEHFNNVEFCTTVGCNCKEFKEYPPQ